MKRDLLQCLIWMDIRQIPNYMLKQVTPLCVAQQVTGRRRKSFNSFLLHKKRGTDRFPGQKLSHLHPNLRLHGLTANGGSSFAEWFKAVPANTQVDKEFTCDRNTKLTKDTFKNSTEFDEYLNISQTI
jgi:hypothetical protein